MRKSKFPLPIIKNLGERLVTSTVAIAANQSAQQLLSIPLLLNRAVVVDAWVKASCGVEVASFAVVVDATANTFTAVAHGLVLGQPVVIAGAVVPTGMTANTVYYAGTILTDSFKLYPTLADAAASSNAVDPSSTGTTVTAMGCVETGIYRITGAASNRAACGVKVSGTPTLVAYNNGLVASAGTLTAGTNLVKITATTNAAIAVRFEVAASILETSNNAF